MKKLVFTLGFTCIALLGNAQSDTLHVYFATGKSTMTPGVEDQLIEYLYNDVLHPKQALQIIGYADYVGANRSNDALSRARAMTVKKFLMGYGIRNEDVTICVGKGEVAREGMSGNSGFTHDRRVDIVTGAVAPPPPAPEPAPAPPPVPPVAVAPAKPSSVPDLSAAKVNQVFKLEKIYFPAGSHKIKPESETTLNDLYTALQDQPQIKISIEGHVCCVRDGAGDALDFDTHEIALSTNRARAIYDYLVKRGIAKERLSYKGFGATHRIAPETTEEEADKNRRVELRILK